MSIQRKIAKGVVLLTTFALLLIQTPGMMKALADPTDKTITGLGTGTIANPLPDNGGWSYVFYGKFDGNPVKYRVLDKASADFGVSGGSLLLDCDRTLYQAPFDSDKNKWIDSSIRKGLNGEQFLTKAGVFTEAERAAIACSKKDEPNPSDGIGWNNLRYAPLTGEQIFLLDAREASRSSYGYCDRGNTGNHSSEDMSRQKMGVYATVWWWLRSPHFEITKVGNIYEDGTISALFFTDDTIGVSPAFNISLSSIIFSSAIPSEPRSYKLTLKDNSLSVNTTGAISRSGNAITVPCSFSSGVNRISVLMTDRPYTENGAVVRYYGKLSDSRSFTLPDDYQSSWKTYILAERVNGEKETDYASIPVEIMIPADSAEKKPAESEQNIISDSGEKDEAGSTFYPLCARQKKVRKNAITFTWNKVKGATGYVVYGCPCGTHKSQKLTTTAATSYTWKKLKKGTYYKIYVVAKNGADVISISKKVHVATPGKRYGNATSVSVKKKSVKLKKGKTCKLGASARKKGTVKQHRRLSYETTNPAVATVSSSGKIKAVGKGTCYIYAYTQNGLFKRVKVTVKK